jgi:hypothetical protein
MRKLTRDIQCSEKLRIYKIKILKYVLVEKFSIFKIMSALKEFSILNNSEFSRLKIDLNLKFSKLKGASKKNHYPKEKINQNVPHFPF